MEKRIELERRARKANQITELNLDNCRSTSIVGLTDEYTALESLSLINVGLVTLKGFPKLPNLKKLELSDNRVSNGLNYLHTSPKLQYLNLSGNKIKDLDSLKPLEEFKHLAVLDLFNNEVTQIENYREKMFQMLPSLKFLDGYDCNDAESPSEGEEEEVCNYSDEDDNDEKQWRVLSSNGLDINLDEFEAYEQRIKAKRQLLNKNNNNAIDSTNKGNNNNNSVNVIDQQLQNTNEMISSMDSLALTTTTATTPATAATTSETNKGEKGKANESVQQKNGEEEDELDIYLKNLQLNEKKQQINKNTDDADNGGNTQDPGPSSSLSKSYNKTTTSFTVALYWLLAIIHLASLINYRHSETESESGEEGAADGACDGEAPLNSSDEGDNGEVSLSEVYNEDLEEDEEDWDEEHAGEEGEEEEDDEDEDGEDDDEEGADSNEEGAAEVNASAKKTTTTASVKDTAEGAESKMDATDTKEDSHARGKKRKHDG